jgi:putative ABC transport system ATP-binding protein
VIELQGLGRDFLVGDQVVHALRDIDLSIQPGEYISIMGPSGSGKSTLLNVLGLLDRPDRGRYLLEGDDVTALDEEGAARVRRDKIGFVFQFFHLVPRLSAADNIALPMVLAGIDPLEREQRVGRMLDSLALSDRGHHRPDQLSGGQRQRVAIARAVVMNPSLILADEPTGNLDTQSGQDVLRLLEQFNAEGKTLLVVTHDPDIGDRSRRRIRIVDGAIQSDVQN